MDTSKFFQDLFGKADIRFICNNGVDKRIIVGRYEDVKQVLKELNKQRYNIQFDMRFNKNLEEFFVTNYISIKLDVIPQIGSGILCSKWIESLKKAKEFFGELSLFERDKHKKILISEVLNCDYKPYYILETEYGFQVYWKLTQGVGIEEIDGFEQAVLGCFKGIGAFKDSLHYAPYYYEYDNGFQECVLLTKLDEKSYEIKSLTKNFLDITIEKIQMGWDIEEIANRMRKKGTFNKISPKLITPMTSETSDKIEMCILSLIGQKGYTTMSEILLLDINYEGINPLLVKMDLKVEKVNERIKANYKIPQATNEIIHYG